MSLFFSAWQLVVRRSLANWRLLSCIVVSVLVAIAVALAHTPPLLLADEPTGELDSATGATIFALLKEIVKQEKVAIIVA